MNLPDFSQLFLYLTGKMLLYTHNPLKLIAIPSGSGEFTTIQFWLAYERLFDMAKPSKSKKPFAFPEMQFINYRLNAEEKETFYAWYSAKGNTVIEAIYNMIQAEYKVSLSYDHKQECFIVALTGREESLNPGKCLTIRSTDWLKALAAVAWVDQYVFNSEIWEIEERDDLV